MLLRREGVIKVEQKRQVKEDRKVIMGKPNGGDRIFGKGCGLRRRKGKVGKEDCTL